MRRLRENDGVLWSVDSSVTWGLLQGTISPHRLQYVVSFNTLFGCKHSKVDQESAPVYESHDFLGQTPISNSKMLFKLYIFMMSPSIVKLGTQIQNMNMRSSKPIIKSDA